MRLNELPLFARLEAATNVLIAGAGGGYDVFAGLPLYFHLKARGKAVHLANLSFVNVARLEGARVHPNALEVTAQTAGSREYFPELALAQWLESIGESASVFALEKVGARPLTAAYSALQRALGFDAVILIDGGTDILMRGDEADLGTPAEDISSLAAVDALNVPTKLLACLGFGVDRHHGVCHAHFLENTAALQKMGAFLGVTSLLPGMPEVVRYREAVAWATKHFPRNPSIVSLSIDSAIAGEYGDVHRTSRTQGSELWINPLMSMYWAYELSAVAKRCLYLDDIRSTETAFDIANVLEAVRETMATRPRKDIPV